ncbi:quinone oxidoreductase family protein [Futiania mangrovi]|uniref:Quinone oxidoreductase n=1 Tax=Futiania mangrovi TaxID=2959716 RepID=A0A9J6PHB1_9PROT|nr:quinone oxidoreductase [Futiania mangrovii]MCP1337894.1 quinone oxidoreductase [Futiania mangrovii]
MPRAVRIHETGGPEVLKLEEVDVPAPGPGEVRLRQTACGVNFTDIYTRTGLYPAQLPCIPGREGVGVIDAVGEGVSGWQAGDRVSYASVSGAYAGARVIAAHHLVRLPDGIGDVTAAAITLRGLTAHMLLHAVHPVRAGEPILVHAAAGGVGLILAQWAAALGAEVIGTVSTEEKATLARAHGSAHVIVGRDADVPRQVAEITGGRMVGVVYDAIGRETFVGSLDSLARRGHLVCYGQASGPIPPIAIQELGTRGSLTVTRPMLGDYIADPQERADMAADLFARVAGGEIRVRADHVYAFEEVARAHADLEAGRTTGSVVLTLEG